MKLCIIKLLYNLTLYPFNKTITANITTFLAILGTDDVIILLAARWLVISLRKQTWRRRDVHRTRLGSRPGGGAFDLVSARAAADQCRLIPSTQAQGTLRGQARSALFQEPGFNDLACGKFNLRRKVNVVIDFCVFFLNDEEAKKIWSTNILVYF